MQLKYQDFESILNIGIGLTTEKDRNHLLDSILENGLKITHCDAGTLYLLEENQLVFKIMKTLSMGVSRGENGEVIDDMPPVPMREENVCAYTAIHREIINIPDVYHSDQFDFSGPKKYDALTGYHTQSLLVIPIENNENELLGVLQLINAQDEQGNVIPFDEQYHIIIRSLGSMTAIALANLSYMEELKEQLHSFVEAFAAAIDERTPYNGSHTRKVAEYAGIIADYISRKYKKGEEQECFDDDRKEKLLLAALLHDIGKMIIPLKVMNRATRLDEELERIENRFELLKTYYEIDKLKGNLSEEEYLSRVNDLDKELEFIHKINYAGFLDDENLEHVKRLAKKKYVKSDGTEIPYLTEEEFEYLSIRKGTLTEQDRKIMESHVVMTGKILEKVRFNKNYKEVPKWAAEHHEYLDGSGYPNHLQADQLDIETRILTVADIYDALTASDRPYKKPMPKEKAIAILYSMADEGKLERRLVSYLEKALG